MGWSSQVVIAQLVIIEGPDSGLFVYNGTPAAGNLVATVTAGPGTDQFGNTFFGGISTYDPVGNVTEIASGSLFTFGSGGVFANLIKGAYLAYQSGGGAGNLIASIAPAAGTDSAGNNFPQGFASINPATGVLANLLGAVLQWTQSASPAPVDPQIVATPAASGASLELVSGAGTGKSEGIVQVQDSSGALGFGTNEGIVVERVIVYTGGGGGAGPITLNSDSTGAPTITNGPGLTQQISGSKLANPAAAGPYPIQDTGTTQTSLGFMTVPANDVETGSSYQIHASGSFSTGTSVPSSATFTVFWGGIGGTAIATLAIPGTLAASLSGAGWFVDAEVNWVSTTQCEVRLIVGWHTSSGVSGSEILFVVANTSGLTTSSNENLSLGFKWGSAPTGTNFLADVFRAGRVA